MEFDQKTIIKWVLIGAGVYLLYRWLSTTDLFGTATQAVTAGAGTTAALPAATTTTAPVAATTPVTPTPPAVTPSNDNLMLAAADQSKVGLVGDFLLNAWQWNYYRGQYFTTVLKQPFDAATMTPNFPASVDPTAPITVSAYWQILRTMGLSGLGWSNGLSFGVAPRGGRTLQ